MLERLKEKLSLTDDQTGQIKQILKEQMQQGRALRQDDSLSDDDRRAKMLALMKTAHDQIRALLTPDQQKIFDTMPMGGGRRRGSEEGASGAPPPGEPPPPLPPPPPS
jgi:hypothetical protein